MGGLGAPDRARLVAIARGAIERALSGDAQAWPPLDEVGPALGRLGACFVTLRVDGALRGCVGSIEPSRALALDAAKNARSAATADPRFAPMTIAELSRARISVAVLGALVLVPCATRAEFERALVPGTDGAVISEHGRRATFLPAVWAGVTGPHEFVDQLLVKLGRDPGYWSDAMVGWSYEVQACGEEEPAA